MGRSKFPGKPSKLVTKKRVSVLNGSSVGCGGATTNPTSRTSPTASTSSAGGHQQPQTKQPPQPQQQPPQQQQQQRGNSVSGTNAAGECGGASANDDECDQTVSSVSDEHEATVPVADECHETAWTKAKPAGGKTVDKCTSDPDKSDKCEKLTKDRPQSSDHTNNNDEDQQVWTFCFCFFFFFLVVSLSFLLMYT